MTSIDGAAVRRPVAAPRARADAAGQSPTVVFAVLQKPGRSANGGVESITQVVERLRGVRRVMVTQIESSWTERWRRAGAEVHVWPIPYEMGASWKSTRGPARARRVASLLATNLRMRALVRRLGCRVLHCNDILALFHYGPGGQLAGARVVHNVRDTKPDGSGYGRRWRVALRKCASTLVLSREMQASLRQAVRGPRPGGAADRIGYIYSIVDPGKMKPLPADERRRLRAALEMEEGELALGYVAAFNPKKAQLAFIQHGLPELVCRVPGARVHFVGDFDPERDPYARACREAVQALGLERHVRFVGYASRMAEWYAALDLVVLASTKEGLARCMIESIACGTPVVSFAVCSAREILEGHGCGIVADQGDYPALAGAVERLARDPALLREMGLRGVRTARELFDPARVVAEYEAHYRMLAGTG